MPSFQFPQNLDHALHASRDHRRPCPLHSFHATECLIDVERFRSPTLFLVESLTIIRRLVDDYYPSGSEGHWQNYNISKQLQKHLQYQAMKLISDQWKTPVVIDVREQQGVPSEGEPHPPHL